MVGLVLMRGVVCLERYLCTNDQGGLSASGPMEPVTFNSYFLVNHSLDRHLC